MALEDTTALDQKKWTATLILTGIYWHKEAKRFGDELMINNREEFEYLQRANAIANIKRIFPDIETAVIEAPEDTSRNYRRRGR